MVVVLPPCYGTAVLADDDEAAIRSSTGVQDHEQNIEHNHRETAAWNAGDAKAMAMLYTTDATWINTNGAASRGRDAIKKLFTGWFAGEFIRATLVLTEKGIQFVKADAVVVDGTWTISGMRAPDGKEIPPIKCFYMGKYVMQDGKWLVAALQSLMPPQPSGP
jgi:uncharacterized protein (TIGR02246 family)